MERLKKKGLTEHHALFPSLGYGNETGFYTISNINRMKQNVEKEIGMEFRIKDLRASMTQVFVSMDSANLNDVSAQLRHDDVRTTQKSHASIEVERVGENLRRKHEGLDGLTPKTPLLDQESSMSSYA